MKSTELQQHSQDEMRAATEALQDAEFLVQAGRITSAVSRAYYAIFHAALAVLNVVGRAPVTHRGVKSEFARLLVKTSTVERLYNVILQDARDLRQAADYEVSEHEWLPTAEEAQTMVRNARKFVDRMQVLMRDGAQLGVDDSELS